MNDEKMILFVHRFGAKPIKVEAERGEILRDVLAKSRPIVDGELVFLGECTDSLKDAESDSDAQETVDVSQSLDDLHVQNHEHIHCSPCDRIEVEINFGGGTKQHRFSPATTVETAATWAKNKFKLDDGASANLVLQKCGTQDQPRSNQHLGEIVEADHCAVCFDLVMEVTPQG